MSSTGDDGSLPIALDAMGGDVGLDVSVEGAVLAAKELGISSVLVGDQSKIKRKLNALSFGSDSRISVQHASEVVHMEESPAAALRRKPDSSIRVAFDLVQEKKASAVVSAGNTGAFMAAGVAEVGTLSGIGRPAIASLVPRVGKKDPTVLLDSGANIDCHAYQLVQFALMGNYYAQSAIGCSSPRIALLSNGTEPTKGTDLIRSAAVTLSAMPNLNFVGYVEGNKICKDVADVVVCDGLVGNVLLKTIEGTVDLVFDSIKHDVESHLSARLGIWLAKPVLRSVFREKLDPCAYGGAPLLGLNEVAVVCHGAVSSRGIYNGIRVARKFVQESLVFKISSALSAVDLEFPGGYEDGIWGRVGQKFEKAPKPKKAKKGQPEKKKEGIPKVMTPKPQPS